MTLKFAYTVLLAGSVALAGCSTQPLGGSSDVRVVGASALPAPTSKDIGLTDRAYLVGAFDKLKIDVYGVPEMTQRIVQVDASGRLAFPLAGTIDAAGKTPGEVGEIIAQRLAGNVRNPQVTVNLEETVSQVVAVDGQVQAPGLYPVIGHMTLMRAVATAKGLGELAKQSDVVVFRTVDGQKMAALYNLGAIRRGAYPDPEIYANDVVVVGDSPGRRLFKDVIGASALVTTPLVILLNRR